MRDQQTTGKQCFKACRLDQRCECREALTAAFIDTQIGGNGFLRRRADGSVERVDPAEFFIMPKAKGATDDKQA